MSMPFAEYPLLKYHADFKRHFGKALGRDAGRFLDKSYLQIGLCGIDVIALDDALKVAYGGDYEDTEPDGCSMAMFIEREYGAAARAWVGELL